MFEQKLSGRALYYRYLRRAEIDKRLRAKRLADKTGCIAVDIKGYLDGIHYEVEYEMEVNSQ